ncbi:MAG: hypothetical protein ACM359_18980 [Bacillota bacterium]
MATPQAIPTANASGSRRRPTPVLIIAATATVGVLIVLALVCWKPLGHRPPSPAGDPVAIAKFTATPDFAQMSLEQKAQYLQALRAHMPALVAAARSGKLTREEQISAVRNGVKAGAQVEMRNYFALPPGPARQAHLDKLIDEQEMLRGLAAQARKDGPLQFSSGVELKQFTEALPPGDRVQMAQFGFDLFKRRRERGLPLWPYSNSDR